MGTFGSPRAEAELTGLLAGEERIPGGHSIVRRGKLRVVRLEANGEARGVRGGGDARIEQSAAGGHDPLQGRAERQRHGYSREGCERLPERSVRVDAQRGSLRARWAASKDRGRRRAVRGRLGKRQEVSDVPDMGRSIGGSRRDLACRERDEVDDVVAVPLVVEARNPGGIRRACVA